jgi:hypothetical protein
LLGTADKIYVRYKFGDYMLVLQDDDCIENSFFVNSLQQATAKEFAVWIEIFGFNPFSGMEIHGSVVG